MRKKLVLMLIITILISIVVPNFIYAEGDEVDVDLDIAGNTTFEDALKHEAEKGKKAVEDATTKGEASMEPSNGQNRNEKIGETASASSVVASITGSVLGIPAKSVTGIMQILISFAQGEIVNDFTIEGIVFNRYELFNINFFDYKENDTSVNNLLRKNVAQWYYALRNIAIVGSLFVLIYIGIRMAISTLASDKAKYKKMFVNWVISFVLIFIMHYIVIILLEVQDWASGVIGNFVKGEGFEEFIINDTWKAFMNTKGWDRIAVLIQLYMLVYNQVKFFLAYLKRFLSTAFLLIISPLVTLTYAIDAVGDGKAQAYNAWLKNIMYNIFIQIIHAILYVVFIGSASAIVRKVPIMGIFLIWMLSRTEKIVKSALKLSGKGIADESFRKKIKAWRHRK